MCSGSLKSPGCHLSGWIYWWIMLGQALIWLGRWAFCFPLDGASDREYQPDPPHLSSITNHTQLFKDAVWQPLVVRLLVFMVPKFVEKIQPSGIHKVVDIWTFWVILTLWIICPLFEATLTLPFPWGFPVLLSVHQPAEESSAWIDLRYRYSSVGAFYVVISINHPSERCLLVIHLCSNKPNFFNSQLWSAFGSVEIKKETERISASPRFG